MTFANLPHWKLKTVTAILLLASLTMWGGIRAIHGIEHLRLAKHTVENLELRPEGIIDNSLAQMSSLQLEVSQLETQLREARNHLAPFLQLSSLITWMPKVGSQVATFHDMLDLGDNLVRASKELLAAVRITAYSEDNKVSIHLLEDGHFNRNFLSKLTQAEPLLLDALTHMDRAKEIIESLESRMPLDHSQGILASSQQILPYLEAFARTGLTASQSWEAVLGYDITRTYLIVAQNSDELRATGGFIPGAWLLTMHKGEIVQLEFWDTMDVDKLSAVPPLPPEGLLQSLWGGAWMFRDAGWFPHFPTSARVMENIFRLGQGVEVDGIITLDQWAVQTILEATGPIVLPTGESLDSGSYISILERETDTQGRQFMDIMLEALLQRLQGPGLSQDVFSILAALNASLHEKHILLFFHDPDVQNVVAANGWDGSLMNNPGDYIMVVDSNVGFSKVNRNIDQHISYTVDLSVEKQPEARLDILYTNQSAETFQACSLQTGKRSGLTYHEQKNACYWDYLRVYVPPGSSLQHSSPFPMPEGALYRQIGYNDIENTGREYDESGKAVFAGFFNLGAGESKKVAFVYNLPDGVLQRDMLPLGEMGQLAYSLSIQKQPGTQRIPMDITVRFPPDYKMHRSSVQARSLSSEEVEFELNLNSDTTIELILVRK